MCCIRLCALAFALMSTQVLSVDGWLHFRASRKVGALVKALREQVSKHTDVCFLLVDLLSGASDTTINGWLLLIQLNTASTADRQSEAT